MNREARPGDDRLDQTKAVPLSARPCVYRVQPILTTRPNEAPCVPARLQVGKDRVDAIEPGGAEGRRE